MKKYPNELQQGDIIQIEIDPFSNEKAEFEFIDLTHEHGKSLIVRRNIITEKYSAMSVCKDTQLEIKEVTTLYMLRDLQGEAEIDYSINNRFLRGLEILENYYEDDLKIYYPDDDDDGHLYIKNFDLRRMSLEDIEKLLSLGFTEIDEEWAFEL